MLAPELQAKVTKIVEIRRELLKEVFDLETILQDKLSPAFEASSKLSEEEKELNTLLGWLNGIG